MAEYTLVQKEVDLRVAAVRKIWDEPTTYSMKSEGSLKSTMKAIDEVVRELDALGIDTAEYRAAVKRYTRHVDCNYTIRNFPVDAAEAELLDYDRRVMEWNEALESSASEMERAQVRITNEYRLMMGRRAVVLDERLLKAARGHSDEMSRLGYFSHTSPTEGRQTPMHRVALEGYKGMPVSENIHMGTGTPEGAHHGWTHSSGHHRNILQPFWTEMGTGNSGRYWTQNFGRTELHKFPNE